MKLNKKSILALVLSLAMVLTLIPVSAFADDETVEAAPVTEIEADAELLTEENIEELVEEILEQESPEEEPTEEAAEELAEETTEETAEVVEEAEEAAEQSEEEAVEAPAEEGEELPAEECEEPETAEEGETAEEATPEEAEGEVVEEGTEEIPAEELAEEFDIEKAKNELLNCTSEDEVSSYLGNLGENAELLVSSLTEDEIRSLAEAIGISLEEEIITPAANYTEVGPLMPPVTVTQPKKKMLMKAAPLTGTNDLSLGASNGSDNGLELNKTSVANGDGTYKITLEAYTTGTVTNTEAAVPTDVVLVLDESGSMTDKMYSYEKVYSIDSKYTYYVKRGDSYIAVNHCNKERWIIGIIFPVGRCSGWYTGGHFLIHWGTKYEPMNSATDSDSDHVQFYTRSQTSISKSEALKEAAADFVTDVYNDAVAGNVDHRVSVIGFSDNASLKIGLADDIRNNKSNVDVAINRLSANGGTYIEKGLNSAKNVFDNASTTASITRNRVVVIFTDGIPGDGEWETYTIENSADPAIEASKSLKTEYGATVYTIGLLDDADPELEISDEKNDKARTNKFLHYLSSNYPNAESMTSGGEGSNQGYYLSASDANSLNAIFKKISQQIASPTIDLGSSTVVSDVVSKYFNVPSSASAVKVYTADYNGSTFGARASSNLTPTINGDTVTVTGFDFNANFVSDTPRGNNFYGKKLIIEFTVDVKAEFLGGNKVPTNGENSGVYTSINSTTPLETFVVPTVDVPIKQPAYTANTENIYYNGTGLPGASDLFTVTKYNDWRDAYVDLDRTTFTLTSSVSNTQDGTYSATMVVYPELEGSISSGSFTASGAKVNVFKPDASFVESAIYWSQVPDDDYYNANNYTDLVWKHGNDTDETVDMFNDEPYTSISYAPASTTFTTCTKVTPSLYIGDTKYADEDQFTVHVILPDQNFKDSTIYYTQTPDYDENSDGGTTWTTHAGTDTCNATVPASVEKPSVVFSYSIAENDFDSKKGCQTVTVSAIVGGKSYTFPTTKSFMVHVLFPTITWADEECFYGDSVPTSFDPESVEWLSCTHNKSLSTSVPTITYTFKVGENITTMPNKNVPVEVTAKIGNTVINDKTTFEWHKCSTDVDADKPTGKHFLIHPKYCKLTITKTGCEDIDENQAFIFNLSGGNVTTNVKVAVIGNSSVTIDHLPIGFFTVTEDSNWSWRYSVTTTGTNATATLSKSNVAGSCIINNHRGKELWLNGCSYAVNTWVDTTSGGVEIDDERSRRRQ